MAELKTKETSTSFEKFLKGIKEESRRSDCAKIAAMMKSATKAEPKMWGSAIVGFGNVHLKYDSGRELDWFRIGFSPRKQNLVLYGMLAYPKAESDLKKLGKHKTGKGCLYINSLDDIDAGVLKKMIEQALKAGKKFEANS